MTDCPQYIEGHKEFFEKAGGEAGLRGAFLIEELLQLRRAILFWGIDPSTFEVPTLRESSDRMIEMLHREGIHIVAIGKRLGISQTTVRTRLVDMGIL